MPAVYWTLAKFEPSLDCQSETDIEHIVATSEAHDSGLYARDRATRARFASDLRNLTLASPRVDRHQKRAKDAAEWLPELNRCWFPGLSSMCDAPVA